jgi:hypothetical protein
MIGVIYAVIVITRVDRHNRGKAVQLSNRE